MNEDLIKCIDCESCINGKCEFCNGAEIEDVNEEFVCMYFSQKNEISIDHVCGRRKVIS